MSRQDMKKLKAGDFATFSKTVSESDIYQYAGVTGDFNPAHIDEEYAKNTIFKTRIAHGMLTAGFISNIIGTRLPGPGTIYLEQSLKFTAPVRIGDTVIAKVEVLDISQDGKRAQLKTTCENQSGATVLVGEAKVIPPQPTDTQEEEV